MEKLNLQKKELIKVEVLPPLSESLLSADTQNSVFDTRVTENLNLKNEIQERKELISKLENFYQKVPIATTTLEEALAQKNISEDEVLELLVAFNQAFQNPENSRLLLYYPAELIPEANSHIDSEELADISDSFRKTLLTKWRALLPRHDFRTNFVDGDILEPELRTQDGLPLVSKAAHMIPILLQKGLITMEEVVRLCEDEKDPVVKNSIFDALPVALDMKFITENELKLFQKSSDSLTQNMSAILSSMMNEEKPIQEENSSETLISLTQQIKEKVSNIDVEFKNTNAKNNERKDWEKKRDTALLVSSAALEIKKGILNKTLSLEEISEFGQINPAIHSLIVIEGIREAVNSLSESEEAKELIKEFAPILEELKKSDEKDVQDYVEQTWANWEHKKYNTNYGNKVAPRETIDIANQADQIKKYAKTIEENEEISKYLYPALILYGSKIKGYGNSRTDSDVAIFIKPGIDKEDRPKIQDLVAQSFTHEKLKDKPMEFWLKDEQDHLEIIDSLDSNNSMGNSLMLNVLWNGAWCGEKKAIEELCNKLVAEYFYDTDKKINGIPLREILLKQLERDTLQYRLMHKGYQKLHAKEGGVSTPHSKDIDSESAFWDSGYRRLATRLFIEKVFIPNLDKKDK